MFKRFIAVVALVAVLTVPALASEGRQWPEHVFAPYVDMVAWVNPASEFSVNGAPGLGRLSEETGTLFFKLGFIQAVPGAGVSNGKVVWGWGGHGVLAPGQQNSQYAGIRQGIDDVRALGGDVAVSIGGLYGITPWEVTQDVDVLVATYLDIINEYGLTRLDLDIETAGSTVEALNIINARAIRQVQEQTGVEIALTLPVLPSGLTSRDQAVLRAYLSEGVDVALVNIMAMAYGPATIPEGHNYGTASILASENTMRQIQDFFLRYAEIELTEQEAYARLGSTISIGFEGSAHPIFTPEWAELVVEHAIENGYGLASFWSVNRDAFLETPINSGLTHRNEFTEIYLRFHEVFYEEDEDKEEEKEEKPPTTPEPPNPPPIPPPVEPEPEPITPEVPPAQPEPPTPPPAPPEPPTQPEGVREFLDVFGTVYTRGEIWSFNGQLFEVLQTFTYWGDPNWKPGIAHSLWRVYNR